MSFSKKPTDNNSSSSNSPERGLPVAVTMGCPAGVGPEVALKAILALNNKVPGVIVGDINILRHVAMKCGINARIEPWPLHGQGPSTNHDVIYCLGVTELSTDAIEPGKATEVTGQASYDYILKAVELCQNGLACAIATAPISKTGLKLAGIDFPGHTEILASLTSTDDFLMMMAGPQLRVTLVTIHVPLREVSSLLSQDLVYKTIRITWEALKRDFGIEGPRIAVCGLNPHAGEGGMFGLEEEEIIRPACERAKSGGMDVTGPLPPDTVFHFASQGKYHAVVCQYHDQGLIPFKLLHFADGVNVTLGLPIVRTSVDHGTAYDIAWKGEADCRSMIAAMKLARKIYENRNLSGT